MYRVTKHYGHELGLSCVFRQWRAASHCALLHGYALAFTFVFEASALDKNGWVVDYGNLSSLKSWLRSMFDHTLMIAKGDPHISALTLLGELGVANHVVLNDGVGCEAFAKLAYSQAVHVVRQLTGGRVRVVSCTVHEHGANSATYMPAPEVQV
jgi:6-pyruvoyltetrahydropterin/6-carboxytetrahydropterin synthase